jgi:ribonuclease-3
VSRLTDRLQELGIQVDPQLLDLAFTHRSWAYENGRGPTNERLEFLGDSVLGVIVTEHIFRSYPERPEGQLAKLRATVVSGHTLAGVARQFDLGSLVKLGRGEIATHGEAKESILADVMEAVIGAVHLTGGFKASELFVHSIMIDVITTSAQLGAGLDWKSSLQELAQELGLGAPVYSGEASGPDHERLFFAQVCLNDEVLGQGRATSRRGAEHIAAEMAYEALSRRSADQASPVGQSANTASVTS